MTVGSRFTVAVSAGQFKNRQIVRNHPRQVVFSMFLNVAWDVNSAPVESHFDNMICWVVRTVRLVRESGHRLILRFHPIGTSELEGARPLRELRTAELPDLDALDGVTLINSDHNVNTYDLANESSDIVLVFNGTLGHELPFLGIQGVAAS
jgi:hypothetical protein